MQDSRGRGSGGSGGGGPNVVNNGWPLGLQPLHMHIQMMNVQMSRASTRSREQQQQPQQQHLYSTYMNHHHHHVHHHMNNHHQLRFLQGDVSPFFISNYTPSISSLSSSDLDTESTGSFFPERSTTLGTLIGIHSRNQRNQPAAMDNVTTQLLQSKQMKKAQRLHACWCAFTLVMKCACSNSNVNPIQESLSPSLAHLLELERRAAHTQPREGATMQCETFDEDNEFQEVEESSHYSQDIALFDGVGEGSHHNSRITTLLDGVGESSNLNSSVNTVFDDDGILPPQPSGAPLKAALRQFTTSPTTSSYLSTDWSAGVPIVRKRKHYHSSHGRFYNSLCPSFWKLG